MRVDFDFHGHTGYWIVRRNVSIDLPVNHEFRFALRATSPTNNLEFKLIDETNANVWWSRNLNFDFPAKWQTLARRKRQICFAWGPSPGFDIHHVAAIEFAISTGSGGKGSLWIDELSLTPLREESPFDVVDPVPSNPIVGSWESAALSPDGSGASLDFAADGTFAFGGTSSGTIGGNPATFTNAVTGRFDGPNATGTYTASAEFDYQGTHYRCTSGTKPWTAALQTLGRGRVGDRRRAPFRAGGPPTW